MAIVTCPSCGAKNRVDQRGQNLVPVCGKCGAKLAQAAATGGGPIEVTDATFEQQLRAAGEKPVLVDCWAEWCPPCRMIAPTIDQLAAESDGRYIVAKLNVDQSPGVAQKFQISSIPTLLIFKNGRPVDRVVGLQPKQALQARLAAHA